MQLTVSFIYNCLKSAQHLLELYFFVRLDWTREVFILLSVLYVRRGTFYIFFSIKTKTDSSRESISTRTYTVQRFHKCRVGFFKSFLRAVFSVKK